MKDLSIIVVSYNTKELIAECLLSVMKFTSGLQWEIIVVDNYSTDGSRQYLSNLVAQNKAIKLVKSRENMGFAVANNQGVKIAKGRYVLFLNSDTLIEDNFLNEMVMWMDKHRDVGVTSCMLKNRDGRIQGTGGYFPTLIRVFSWMTIEDIPFVDRVIRPFHPVREKSFFNNREFYKRMREIDWVSGAFMLVRREVFDQGVRWDENFFMYGEDVDFCFQVKKLGWKVYYLPMWSIIHLGGASSTNEFPILSEFKGIKIFYKKHHSFWQYPLLRLFLKVGSLGRAILFVILEGRSGFKVYAQAFKEA